MFPPRIWEKARSRAIGLGRSCTFCSASGYCAAKVAFRAWNGRVMSGLNSYFMLFQCYFYIFLPILENLIYLSTILFFFRTLRDWFATICRFLEYHDLYVGAHLRISHAVYRWFSCELHWDCWGVWHSRSFEYDPVGKVTYIWVNLITTETCDLTGIMVSIGNHPQMAWIQVSEMIYPYIYN